MTAVTTTQLYKAQQLNSTQRQALALQTLKYNKSIAELSKTNKVSRKFLYQQKHKATEAINDAFAKNDDNVIFYLPITKIWLMSFILCLLLHCRSSIRGVQKLLSDMFDYSISVGSIVNHANTATQIAKSINVKQDLSYIHIAVADELYHQNKPILSGIDSRSLYCYVLTQEKQRDAETWAIHLLDIQKQGFNPHHFIADNAAGLRYGHEMVFPDKSCHGDVFHIIKDLMDLRRFIRNKYKTAIRRCLDIDIKIQKALLYGQNNHKIDLRLLAKQQEFSLEKLSKTIDTLVSWMQWDVLSKAGKSPSIRRELYDFIVEEFRNIEQHYPHRIRKLRIALEHQRDDLLAFINQLDDKLQHIAQEYNTTLSTLWKMCELQRCHLMSDKYAIRSAPLLLELGDELFDVIEESVYQAITSTDRTSCMVENLNSRLRPYLTIRKQIDNDYLQLLQFYLNHTPLLRSKHAYRQGNTPAQIMMGKTHPHWLEMISLKPFKRIA